MESDLLSPRRPLPSLRLGAQLWETRALPPRFLLAPRAHASPWCSRPHVSEPNQLLCRETIKCQNSLGQISSLEGKRVRFLSGILSLRAQCFGSVRGEGEGGGGDGEAGGGLLHQNINFP